MLKKLFLTLLTGLMIAQVVQAQTWQSVAALNSSTGGDALVEASAIDAAGNVYLAGRFFNTIQLGTTTLTCGTRAHLFIAKWSTASHAFVWAVQTGGSGYHTVSKLVVSGSKVYLAGGFLDSTIGFGGTLLANDAVNGSAFVAKLVDAGSSASFGWAQKVANADGGSVYGLAVKGDALYLAGTFRYYALTLGATVLPCAGGTDFFLAKLIDSGTTADYAWAQQTGEAGDETAGALVVVGTSLYVTGTFVGTVTLGNTTHIGGTAYNANGFVAKLTETSSGVGYVWSSAMTGPYSTGAANIAVSGTAVYVAGSFAGATATIGANTLYNAGATGFSDLFVAKLIDAGASATWSWAQRAGGRDVDDALGLLVRGTDVYLGGRFRSSSAQFGPLALFSTPDRYNPGLYSFDVFVAHLLDAGATSSFDWAQSAGSSDYEYFGGLNLLGTTLYVAGGAHLPATFGSQGIAGGGDALMPFLATLANAALPTRATTALPGFTIYPNPAPGAATVRVPAGAGAATVQVLDALGRVVRRATVAAGQDYALALTGLAPGVYAVRVQMGEATATQRLAVE